VTDPWDSVWCLYDGNLDLSLAAIAAETGITSIRIWRAAWRRHRQDHARLNPEQRRHERTLARLRARVAAGPTHPGAQVARHRARAAGLIVPLLRNGRRPLPAAVDAPIVEAYDAGTRLPEIAAAQRMSLAALKCRLGRLRADGVIGRRKASATPRQVAA